MQAVVIAISKEVDTVLTGYCSPTAMKYLTDNGVDVVTGVKGTVAEAVAQYRKQAHAIPVRSKDEPDIAGVALLHALKRSGIISMGPIYAWYPLLKELRGKGATNSLIAVFLGNRAVKPFLLPVMISYFGWVYVLLLTFFTITGSVAAGYLVAILIKE